MLPTLGDVHHLHRLQQPSRVLPRVVVTDATVRELAEVRRSQPEHILGAPREVLRRIVQSLFANNRGLSILVHASRGEHDGRAGRRAFRVARDHGDDVIALLRLVRLLRFVERVLFLGGRIRHAGQREFRGEVVHDVGLGFVSPLRHTFLLLRLGVHPPLEHAPVVAAHGYQVPTRVCEPNVDDVRGVPDVPDWFSLWLVPRSRVLIAAPLHSPVRGVLHHARPVEQLNLAGVTHGGEQLAGSLGFRPSVARVDVGTVNRLALDPPRPYAHHRETQRARLRVPPLVSHRVAHLPPRVAVVVQQLVRPARRLQDSPIRELRVERGPVQVGDVRRVAFQSVQSVVFYPGAPAGYRVARHVVDVDEVIVGSSREELTVGRVLHLVDGLVAVVKFASGLVRSLDHLVELAAEHVVVVEDEQRAILAPDREVFAVGAETQTHHRVMRVALSLEHASVAVPEVHAA